MVGLKKKVVGLKSGKYMVILSMYNFKYDPDLGIRKTACRRIPYSCVTRLQMLNTPWDTDLEDKEQPRYGVNE